jgi:hypothetical protein
VASTHLFLSVLYGNVGAIRAECFESYRSQAPFHGGHTDEKDPSRIRTLSAKKAVSFLCPSQLDVVRFRQLFQRFWKPSMRVF